MIKAILMGLVQGLTEFLPVSSSGHLVIMKSLIGLEEQGILWEVFLHFGTLLAIIVYFRKKLLSFLNKRDILLIFIASIPAGIVGVLFKDYLESLFTKPIFVIPAFLFTATVLFIAGRKNDTGRERPLPIQAFIIGIAQAMALMPGISRSGVTVCAGILLGMAYDSAFEFSFAMAIPALFGAFLLELKDVTFIGKEMGPVLLGTLVAFISGVLAIYLFRRILKKRKLFWFSIYLIFISVLFLLLQGVH